MSLVYNNDKPIGKCESYSIDKVPGTTPFVMLTNYEPLRSELNENQHVVLEWWVKKLNEEGEDADPLGVICAMQSYGLRDEAIYDAAANLTPKQQFQVLAAFAEWGGMKNEQ